MYNGLAEDETPIYDCRHRNYGVQVAVERGSIWLHIREMRNVRYAQWMATSCGRDVPLKPYNRNFMCEGLTLNLAEFRDLLEALNEGTEALEGLQPYIVFLGDRGRRLEVDSFRNVWFISIRRWLKPPNAVKSIPTKMGVTFSKEAWYRFVSFRELLEEDLERNSDMLIGLTEYQRREDDELDARRASIRRRKTAAASAAATIAADEEDDDYGEDAAPAGKVTSRAFSRDSCDTEPIRKVVSRASSNDDSVDMYL